MGLSFFEQKGAKFAKDGVEFFTGDKEIRRRRRDGVGLFNAEDRRSRSERGGRTGVF